MTKVMIYVEGQTEETFVRDVLAPSLLRRDIYPIPVLARTKRTRSGRTFKGGIVSYNRVRRDILRLLGDSSAALVTTMMDYYGLPDDFPGRAGLRDGTPYQRVHFLEDAFARDIGQRRFLPFLTLHEFEALLLAQPERILEALPWAERGPELLQEIAGRSPEEIDEGKHTHPAARIARYFPSYRKPLYGPLIAARIGLQTIRERCPHFDEWVNRLEALQRANPTLGA